MSGWKLPRILLNTKITTIHYSGLLFYYRKAEKSSKNHTGTVWYRMNPHTPDTFSFCAPSTLVDDFTILPIQTNLLSCHLRHTAGFNSPVSFSGSCGPASVLVNGMRVEVMCNPQTHPPNPVRAHRPFPLQLDRMEKGHLGGLGSYMWIVVF